MSYHSREAFEARMARRRALPVPPAPHAAFYHAALMPGWPPIAAEQLALCAHAGLSEVRTFVLGTPADLDRMRRIADHYGVRLDVLGLDPDFGRHEGPTLDALHEWARANPFGAATYFHTKGVSAPGDRHKERWRRLMAKYVVAGWRENLRRLAVADVAGCAWQESRDYPHFCGNFWAARCDWLRELEPPASYRLSRPDFTWAGVHSWRQRMYVETWLGSAPWHHVEERLVKSYPLFSDWLWPLAWDVEGFDYGQTWHTGD